MLVIALVGLMILSPICHQYMDPYILDLVMLIGINSCLAISLTLINGMAGQFSLGHAGFMAVGAYVSASLTLFTGPTVFAFLQSLGIPPSVCQVLWFPLIIICGGLAAGTVSLLIGIPTLRLRGDYLAIATLGFGEIIRVVIVNMKSVGGPIGLGPIPEYTTFFWVFGTCVIAAFVILRWVNSTRGNSLYAVREDEIAAVSVGINTTFYKVSAFVVGAFFAGAAGCLYAHRLGRIEPDSFAFIRSVEIVTMVVLGGLGSVSGAVLGAIALTLLSELPRQLKDMESLPVVIQNLSEYRMIIYAVLLIILMILRPQGLLGHREFSLKMFRLRKYTREASAK